MSDRADDAHALALVRAAAQPDSAGYVHLQTIPYRAHHLLAVAMLECTRPGAVVLEGGVSSGYFARVLTSADRVVDGLELDPDAAQLARDVCRHVWVGDLQLVDPDALNGPYDALLFGDTLEHVPDPAAVLRRLRKVLRDDGTLVISVPNIANWAMRLQVLVGRFRYTDRGILDRTHLRFYTRRTLIEMVESAGYRTVRTVGAIPVPAVRSPWLCRLAHRVGNLRSSLFAYNFVLTAVPA
ncbi:MAG TPA: class I SAM-dependent methyltransferase [Acidimicrobiales bacterium]|nr:class I SAM-dependent methyltransferase [Acidimicrobiales bacterium]